MNKVLSGLQPTNLWENFEALCGIPHPSKKEGKIRDYIVSFGKKLGLETIVDEVGNVIIRKPATPGMENRKGVILQGHIDMVPQKNNDTVHDFEKDPIRPRIDGEWVKATGTTLGADNGVGVAASMAILQSTDIPHGPVEMLCTIDEETGMTGAFGIKGGFLKGDILLNLDSEEEGILCIGCAGGTNANVTFPYTTQPVPAGMKAYTLEIKGLKGGHSGVEINLGRGNSNKLLLRFLYHSAKKHGMRLVSIDGGSLRNAIPRESNAVVLIPADKEKCFLECVQNFETDIQHELKTVDPGVKFSALPATQPGEMFDLDSQNKMINALYALPNGVMRMSNDMENLVETSTNLAIVKSENGNVYVQCLLRSSVDSAKDDLEYMMAALFELAGADANFSGKYPGWKPNVDSPILKEMKEIYAAKFGKAPEIGAIHAGLECGLLGGVYPNWDMISFGPTILHPHSPDEQVSVASVQKFWDFLVDTLKNVPVK
jgi:dipeptidase D